MTAALLILRAQGPIAVHTTLIGVGVLALLESRALVSTTLWYVAAGSMALRIAWDWPLADNHMYLLGYWCLAIALALGSNSPAQTLGRAARWLLACAFTLAVVWKGLLSPDFLDGRFFRMTLIVDERFEHLVRLAGGMSLDELDRHRAALVPLGAGAELAPDDSLVEPPQLQRLARALTWGGFATEAALAAAFLVPLSHDRRWIRHVLLLAFCAATYALVPVAGFGWLLLAMGACQRPSGRVWRLAYIAVWLLVLAGTELPWLGWLADRLGRS
jgi:hypothetical protein